MNEMTQISGNVKISDTMDFSVGSIAIALGLLTVYVEGFYGKVLAQTHLHIH